MRNVVLCQTKRSENPYYIEDVDLYVYSLEELCYFINANLPLIDEAFFDAELEDWLFRELKLDRLQRLMFNIRNDAEQVLKGLIIAVNSETSWLYVEDRKAFGDEIDRIQELPVVERMRQKADTLVKYRKYTKAIALYKQIIETASSSAENSLIGVLYHNMGVSYAKLFQMDEACECLRLAYQNLHSLETLKNYLYCVRIHKGVEAYDRLADELEVDGNTREEMEQEISELKAKEQPEDLDKTLQKWVRDYHRETGM